MDELGRFTGAGPFAGLKVWDAAWVGVGPLTSKYLADYGATVIRRSRYQPHAVLG
jgi:crotonobetainyl-CoA:carnitine CoA-transferase CaiB-like acyl-CoA transferase